MTQKIPTGRFVAQHMELREDQYGNENVPLLETADARFRVQPNGVDLGIESLYRTSGNAVFKPDGDYDKPDRLRVQPKAVPADDGSPVYSIPAGSYVVQYDVNVEIPEGYTGHVYPRSRLMRCGMHLTTALWDQGYEGGGEGLLQVPRSLERVTIPVEMSIAQMTFRPAEEPASAYDGTHQGERLAVGGGD